jgi:flagellar biosynthesis protein FlhG
MKSGAEIWAVGGGKGGVGKSLLSSSLSIALSQHHKKVIAIDLDLGGANLHTTFGVDLPKQTLGDFITGRVSSLEACLTPTALPNLQIISGANDSMEAANIPELAKSLLIQSIRDLDADYILLDLGAGTSLHTIDFFLEAQTGIITVLPEPTSIENGYRFIKSVYYRRLQLTPSLGPIKHLIEASMDSKNSQGIRSPSDLYQTVQKQYPDYTALLRTEIEKFKPLLVLNQIRTPSDVEIGFSMKTVCKKYFGIDMEYIGYLDYDSAVWQSVRRRKPLATEFPNSKLVSNFERIVQHILSQQNNKPPKVKL